MTVKSGIYGTGDLGSCSEEFVVFVVGDIFVSIPCNSNIQHQQSTATDKRRRAQNLVILTNLELPEVSMSDLEINPIWLCILSRFPFGIFKPSNYHWLSAPEVCNFNCSNFRLCWRNVKVRPFTWNFFGTTFTWYYSMPNLILFKKWKYQFFTEGNLGLASKT